MESVKQGSACVGLRSNTTCVLGALKRSVSELSSYQKKLMEVDTHIGVGIAGLTADARSLVKYMQTECLNHKYIYGTSIPPHQLVADLADKHQRTTQTYVRRPYGVGLLLATIDMRQQIPHLYQTCPSGNLYEFVASAIGARSQSARTYFEKHYDTFDHVSDEQLIIHALQALVGCLSGDAELTTENASIVVVSTQQPYTLIEGEALVPYLNQLESRSIETADAAVGDDDDNEAMAADSTAPQAAGEGVDTDVAVDASGEESKQDSDEGMDT
jgi:20S proteasome subunit alpha 6